MRWVFYRVSLAAVSLALAACGGGSTAATTPTSPPAASSSASAAPSATPSATPTVGDVSGAANGLASLSSYKVTVTSTGGQGSGTMTAVVVRQPTLAQSYAVTAAGQTTKIIIIGSDIWIDGGSGTYMKNVLPASAVQGMTHAFDPTILYGAVGSKGTLAGLQSKGIEQKNGVSATHLHADSTTAVGAQNPIPAGANFDIWVAASGNYLVAMEYTGMPASYGATSASIEVTNINDSTLSVTAPS